MQSEEEVTILDVYRLESQEISIDLSDGTAVTLTAQEILALRHARTMVGENLDS